MNGEDPSIKDIILDHDIDRLRTYVETNAAGLEQIIDTDENTMYSFCVEDHWIEGMRYLALVGANVNHVDIYGDPPLFKCFTLEVCRAVIEQGADVSFKKESGLTMRHYMDEYKDSGQMDNETYEYVKTQIEDAEVPLPDVKVAERN